MLKKNQKPKAIDLKRAFYSSQVRLIPDGCGFAEVIDSLGGNIHLDEVGTLVVYSESDGMFRRPELLSADKVSVRKNGQMIFEKVAVRQVGDVAYDQFGRTYQFQNEGWKLVSATRLHPYTGLDGESSVKYTFH